MGLLTPVGTAHYPHFFEPDAYGENTPKYKVTLVLDTDAQNTKEFKAMKKAYADLLKEKFGKAAARMAEKEPAFRPMDDAPDSLRNAGHPDDAVWIRFNSTRKPGVMHRVGKRPIVSNDEIYSGVQIRVSVSLYSYDKGGNKGVRFGLQNVLKVADGERLAGAAPAPEEEFDDFFVADDESDDDWDSED